jgi:RimJ/RimL family protein N-acetyltransferase
MPWCHTDYSIEESRAWVESRAEAWKKGTQYDFVITDARDGSFLGGCGLNHIDHNNRIANLGYWVRTSRTKKGVASAAARLLAQFGLGKLKLNRIEIMAAVGNKASQRVAEKVGAKREGILRNRRVVRERVYDVVMFSLIPEDLT